MGKSEMDTYINKIGRTELFDELKDIHNSAYGLIRGSIPYPRYLKAIRVSLVALGYDEEWVESTFKEALEKKYLK